MYERGENMAEFQGATGRRPPVDSMAAASSPPDGSQSLLRSLPSLLNLPIDNEIVQTGADLLRSTALFMPNKLGTIATASLCALDQVDINDQPAAQLLDGSLGAAKGLLLRGAFSLMGRTPLNAGARGFSLGLLSRGLETSLNRHSFMDKDTCTFVFSKGWDSLSDSLFNRTAAFTDIATFSISHGIATRIDPQLLRRSPLLANALSGASFGLTSGSLAEVQIQRMSGQPPDYTGIIKRGIYQATLDGIAAIPGGLVKQRQMQNLLAARPPMGLSANDSGLATPPMLEKSQRPNNATAQALLQNPAVAIELTKPMGSESAAKTHCPPAIRDFGKTTAQAAPVTLTPVQEIQHRGTIKQTSSKNIFNLPAANLPPLIAELLEAKAENRAKIWRTATHSSDPAVRLLAIQSIPLLPQTQRLAAWRHAFEQGSVLSQSKPITIPEVHNGKTPQRLQEPPAMSLVKAIAHLPGKQFQTWVQALNDPRTAKYAAESIAVLPAERRLAAWDMAWHNNLSTVYSPAKTVTIDSLVSQIPKLELSSRTSAWKAVESSNAPVRALALNQALSSMPEPSRHWASMLNSIHGSGKELASAIGALPEASRYDAWNLAASKANFSAAGDMTRAIAFLPERDRLPALQRAVREFPSPAIGVTLYTIPAEHIPEAIRIVAEKVSKELRAEIWQDSSFESLHSLPAKQRVEIFKEVFAHVSAAGDIDALKTWWSRLPEPSATAAKGAELRPVQHGLAEELPPHVQSSMLSIPAETTLPVSVVRAILRSAGNLEDTAAVRQVVDLLAKVQMAPDFQKALAASLSDARALGFKPEAAAALAELSSRWTTPDRACFEILKTTLLSAKASPPFETASLRFALHTAAGFAGSHPQSLRDQLLAPLELAVGDIHNPYQWRLAVAGEVAAMQRAGILPDVAFNCPDLRMPRVILGDSPKVRREHYERLLRNPDALAATLGKGELGQVFPEIFGRFSETGGIFERPQHSGHEMPLHEHIIAAVGHAARHPQFNRLTETAQTDLLWAALLHDVGKKPAQISPGHELVSANLAWGVLGTMGYSNQRIARITDLISRHSEVSYIPGLRSTERFANGELIDDLGAFYRAPYCNDQLRIMNESDIRALSSSQSHFTPHVQAELSRIHRMLGKRSKELSEPLLPILTSELPNKFGVFALQGKYAVLAHATDLSGSFLRQLSLIQSANFSASTSLLTDQHHRLISPVSMFPLVSAPWEHVSQSYRSNLSTGDGIDWNGHVALAKSWRSDRRALRVNDELDRRLSSIGFGNGTPGRALEEARQRLGQFDTLDAVQKTKDAKLVTASTLIHDALIPRTTSGAAPSHNEVKVNHISLDGLGVLREGRTVALEGVDSASRLQTILGSTVIPKFAGLSTHSDSGTLIIPAPVWEEFRRRNLPIVILDP